MVQPASPHQLRAKGHRRLTFKILVSLTGFGITFALSQTIAEEAQSDLYWSLGASLFVAGIIFVAQFLFDVERRLETIEHGYDVGFSKIHLASELFSLAEASQLKTHEMEQMTKLVRNSTKITSDATMLVQEFAQAEITRLADYLKRLGDASELTYEGEDRDWLLGLTKVVQSSLQATSLSTVDAGGRSFTDGGLWRRDLGLLYLAAQRQAVNRGVKIQRLFIIDRKELSREELTEELNEVLKQHLSTGVEVRQLNVTAPADVHLGLRDFIIFDGVLSYQTTTGSVIADRDPIIVTTTLVTDPAKVEVRRRDFEYLWNAEDVMIMSLNEAGEVTLTPRSAAVRSGVDTHQPAASSAR